MNSDRWSRVKAIYERLDELAPELRGQALDQECGADADLRAEVMRLLGDSDNEDTFLLPPEPERLLSVPPGPGPGPEIARRIGDFTIQEEIGCGSMGVVYLAEQVSLRRRVALKVLRWELSFSADAIERFRSEATAAGRLSHRGIIPVYSVGACDDTHYIAMEYVAGRSLQQILEQLRTRSRPADSTGGGELGHDTESYPAAVARLVADIADALHHSHRQGIVHRDIKPGNVLIDDAGAARITDFGVARDLGFEQRIRTGTLAGTPCYMSPEQARTTPVELDHRTDIFSLGVVMYELLTFRRPFDGESHAEVFTAIREADPDAIRRLNPRVPEDLETICLKAMEKPRERRYPDAGALADDLHRFLRHESILARPPSLVYRGRRFLRRHRVPLTAAVMVAVALAATALTAWRSAEQRRVNEARAQLLDVASHDLADRSMSDVIDVRKAISYLRRVDPDAPEIRVAEERIRDESRRCLESAERSLAEFNRRDHWQRLRSLAAGLEMLSRGVQLSDPNADSPAARADHWYPRLTVRSDAAGHAVFLSSFDRDDMTFVDKRRVGETPLENLRVPPGYYLVTVTAGHDVFAECSVHLMNLLEPKEIVLSPTSSAEVIRDDMALLPGGTVMVGDGDKGDLSGFPQREVELAPFYIDRFEVTNIEYKRFCDATGRRYPALWGTSYDAAWDCLPVAGVNFFDAEAFARWKGKRLPTLAEWEHAARGKEGRRYPWTGEASDELLRGCRLGTHSAVNSTLTGEDRWREELTHYLAAVGAIDSFPAGSTPEGVHLLLGNVEEWTDSFQVTLVEHGRFDLQTGMRIVKGGSFDSPRAYALNVNHAPPSTACHRARGFRCARSASP